jgi:iron(III) transport system ATP-binding protein
MSTPQVTHGAPEHVRIVSPAPGAQPLITVTDLVAGYGGTTVVHGISFEIARGEQLSLLGPSGCGKSTTLRCVAGLETPIAGEIKIDGVTVFSSQRGINLPPERRWLAMVFQSYAIWPHMSVLENVAYGIRSREGRNADAFGRAREALAMVGMAEFGERPATDLSGGQQQRVALARSYAGRPKAVLLDEPLSNLDARLRVRMRDEIKELQHRLGLATIYVTHDQEEAMAISDRIIVMKDGRVEQAGEPLEVYERPRTRFVADFIGAANILSGEVVQRDGRSMFVVGEAELDIACAEKAPAGPGLVALRTVYPRLSRCDGRTPGAANLWPATVAKRVLLGDTVWYDVSWPGGQIRIHALPTDLYKVGEAVMLYVPPGRAVLLSE